jgi:hypothetical protein
MIPTFADFEKNFEGRAVPQVLSRLFAFQQEHNDFSECFWLHYISKAGLKTYSEDPVFLGGIIEFAQATGSGSTYGLWLHEGAATDLNRTPVVALGDEGGMHIVALDIPGLMQLLTFDCEPMIDWEAVYYYKDDEAGDSSTDIDSYRTWLSREFGISPVKNSAEADLLVARAQEQYGERFKAWLGKFYDLE